MWSRCPISSVVLHLHIRMWWEVLNLHHQTPSNPCLCPCISQDILDWRFAWTLPVWKMCGCFIYMFWWYVSMCSASLDLSEWNHSCSTLLSKSSCVQTQRKSNQPINSVIHALVISPLPAALRCALICSLSIPQGKHGFSKQWTVFQMSIQLISNG